MTQTTPVGVVNTRNQDGDTLVHLYFLLPGVKYVNLQHFNRAEDIVKPIARPVLLTIKHDGSAVERCDLQLGFS